MIARRRDSSENALVYVTMNHRKHSPARERATRARALDGMSSALWTDGWAHEKFTEYVRAERDRVERSGRAAPVVRPKTWIARVGWKRHGGLDPRESPRSPG